MFKQPNRPDIDWNAVDYCQHSTAQQSWARELIAKLELQGEKRILDIGCGDGKITAEIAGCVPYGSVTGVDNSPAMIDLARHNFTAEKHPNLSFRLLDAGRMDYKDQFDVIFSNAVLHWIPDHKPVLTGICQALVPGGRILLQMGGKGNADDILKMMNILRTRDEWHDYFLNFTFPYFFPDCNEYEPLLNNAGFTVRHVELFPKDMVYNDKAGLAGWIRTTWMPYTSRIPEALRNKFIDEVVTEYLVHIPPDNNGKIHVAMVRLEVEAVKPSHPLNEL